MLLLLRLLLLFGVCTSFSWLTPTKKSAFLTLKPKVQKRQQRRWNSTEFTLLSDPDVASKFTSALNLYLSHEGNLNLPTNYVVPNLTREYPESMWNYELGLVAQFVRQRRHLKSFPTTLRESLDQLGFIWDTKDKGFREVVEALTIYKELYGDLLVPQTFVIPNPSEEFKNTNLWGMKLGARVKAIRQAHQYYDLNQSATLDRLGFEWDYQESKKEKDFNKDFNALKIYYQENGHLDIPIEYKVPANSSVFPKNLWNIKLGVKLTKIKKGLRYTELKFQHQLQNDLGIEIHISKPRELQHGFKLIYEALLNYKRIYGNLLVPRKFVVPSDDSEWSKELWNIPLGIRVGSIRQGKSYSEVAYAAALDQIGFIWDVADYKFQLFVTALKTYEKLEGDLYIPQCHKIDEDDERWPSHLRGYKLGNKVQRMRQNAGKMTKKHRKKLDDMGFLWQARLNDIYSFDVITRALLEFKEYYGHCNVPVSFIVPLEQSWSVDLWSLPLGTLVQNIRHGKSRISLKEREVLKRMGFLFKDEKKEMFLNETLHALVVYKNIYGHCNVPNAFKISSSTSPREGCTWPEELIGLPLGSRVKAIRQRKTILDDGVVCKLQELGFVFNVQKENNNKLLRACKLYVDIHIQKNGCTLPVEVPDTFKIDKNNPDWPSDLWGYNLGARIKYLKTTASQIKSNRVETSSPVRAEVERDNNEWVMDDKWIRSEINAGKRNVLIMEIKNLGIRLL